MPKKKKAESVVNQANSYLGKRLKVLVEVDGQWYEVDGGTHFDAHGYSFRGLALNTSAIARTIRDVGPIPAPKRWRADA